MEPNPRAVPPEPTGGGGDGEVGSLLTRVATGDQDAFAQLYDRMSARVYGITLRVVVDRAQSQEVTQEVFLEVWRRATRYDGNKGSGVAWIMAIAHSRAVDRVRSEQAASNRDQRYGTSQVERDVDVVADAVDDSLERRQVRRCLGQLTDLQRESIQLAYYSGYTQSQVATALQAPLGTIKTRMRDGLIRLRDCLGAA